MKMHERSAQAWFTLCCMIAATGPAAAETEMAVAAGSLSSGFYAAVFTVALAVLGGQAAVAGIGIRRARKSEALAAYATAVLEDADAAFFTVHESGGFYCSERLRAVLNLPFAPLLFTDLKRGVDMSAIAPESWRSLEDSVTRLLSGGQPFVIPLLVSGRAVRLKGRKLQDPRTGVFALVMLDERQSSILDEEAIYHPNEMWYRLLDAAPFPIWLRDAGMNLTKVNTTYTQAVEREHPRAVLAHGVELASAALAASPRQFARKAFESGETVVHNQYVVIEGQRKALKIFDVPVRGADGAMTAVAGFALDNTELEDVKAHLARTLEAHAETLDRLITPVAIFGAGKRLEFFNSAFAGLWSLPSAWLEEKPRHGELLEAMREQRMLPEQADFPEWKKEQLRRYTTVLDMHEELWHLPDGSTYRVITQPHPMGGLLMLFEDVTDKLALERSYNTLIAVQKETLNNLLEAVAVYGSDGRLQLFNSLFARMMGLDEAYLETAPHFSDILGRIEALTPLGQTATDWKEKQTSLLAAHRMEQGRWERPDGLIYDYVAVPLPDGAMLFTHEDVTASVRVQAALAERNAALEAADKLKSDFVANVSYEFRTPLNSIVGFAEILKNEYFGPLNEKQREYLEAIVASSDELKALINDILDLAAIEAGGLELELEAIPAAELARSVAAMSSEIVRKQNKTIQVDAAGDLGVLSVDRRRMQQTLYSLVLNALRWTREGDGILVSVECADSDDGGVIFSVSDTGPGLTGEQREQLFEALTLTAPRSGTQSRLGISLALVRYFVEMHGGRVTLDSRPDKGTVVSCHLPSVRPAAA